MMLSRLTARASLRLLQPACITQRAVATSSPRLLEAKEAILHNKAESTPQGKSEEESLGLIENQERGLQQAPNRAEIWSRSQRPRAKAMSGPRFEQTDFDLQVDRTQT
jgi:NADH dehydrogenase (ubiquinone) Fe-S protein 6